MSDLAPAGIAADLTADEQQARAELAYELDKGIKAGLRAGREALWVVAEHLSQFDEESGWSALGYDSVTDWLADPEIGMARTVYYRMIRTWRAMHQRQLPTARMAALEVSKVDVVLPSVKAGRVKFEDAIADAETLGFRDLREKYIGSRPDPRDTIETDATELPPPVDADPTSDGTVTTDDVPVLASDVDLPEPAHITDQEDSGQVQEADVIEPPVLSDAVAAGYAALEIARSNPRRSVSALRDLLDAVTLRHPELRRAES